MEIVTLGNQKLVLLAMLTVSLAKMALGGSPGAACQVTNKFVT